MKATENKTLKMTTIVNLPNEVLMKILSYLNITELSQLSRACKRLYHFCKDESLQQKCVEKINLYNKRVPIKFLENILDKGCKYLNINNAFLSYDEGTVKANKINLTSTPQLKYLDITYCSGKENILESLLSSCNSLEKFALQNHLLDEKCHELNWKVSANIISNLCRQNGQTLKTLDLMGYRDITISGITDILTNCVNLREFTPCSLASSLAVRTFVEGITPNIRELNLSFKKHVDDESVKILVERCKKLSALNLRKTSISTVSLDCIVANLSKLEKLDVSQNKLFGHLSKLCQLQKLKTLVIEDEYQGITEEDVKSLWAKIPQLDTIFQPFANIAYSLRIGCASQNGFPGEGFWDIQQQEFPLFERHYPDNDGCWETR